MGKPATTYWCENGHLLEDNPSGMYGSRDMDFGDVDDSNQCQYCGSTIALMGLDWWGDHEPEVPHEPIDYFDVKKEDHHGNQYFVAVPIYDVSKLLAERT